VRSAKTQKRSRPSAILDISQGAHEIAGKRIIAGQELGSKREHLALGAVGRYEPHKILIVGDAPGDLQAAESNGILFYPIDPGFEDESWQRFFEEGLPRFLSENYAGAYMTAQIARFKRLLPDTPPWQGR